ncbi:MAG: hypothetical protein HYX67_14100 [Candidatus Melainabacteria bacterium]|nr:hypothetical protein [Candidatus Melainabacteria bacterium]
MANDQVLDSKDSSVVEGRDDASRKILQEHQQSKQAQLDAIKAQNNKILDRSLLEQFGACQILDNSKVTPVQSEQPLGKPNEVIETKIGDKSTRLELDENGFAKRFVDVNGDQIQKSEDGTWTRSNIMTPTEKLANFSVDKDKSVSITYMVPKDDSIPVNDVDPKDTEQVTREIKSDGTIATNYPDGRSTLCTLDGDSKRVEVRNGSQTVQTLVYHGDDLVEFDAPNGVKYSRQIDQEEADGPQHWTKTTADGAVVEVKNLDAQGNPDPTAPVKADDNGSVIVRDSSEAQNNYAHRYLNNGVQVYSDRIGSERVIQTPDCLTIKETTSVDSKKLNQRQYTYASGRVVNVTFDSSENPISISGNNGLNLSREDSSQPWHDADGNTGVSEVVSKKSNDSIRIVSCDGSTTFIDSHGESSTLKSGDAVPAGKNLEERYVVDQIPADAENKLAKDIEKTSQWEIQTIKGDDWTSSVPVTKESLKGMTGIYTGLRAFGLHDSISLDELKDATKDGGEFDIKQKGGQFQKYGNFQWGVYAASMNLPPDVAIKMCGIYKSGEGKSNSSWGEVSDLTANKPGKYPYGQNPNDAEAIKEGYKYYREHFQPKIEEKRNAEALRRMTESAAERN